MTISAFVIDYALGSWIPATRVPWRTPRRKFGTDQIGDDLGTVLPLRGRARSKTARKKGVHLGA
jgi:hypothetical protein